jgi:Flp pilus assembly protein TadD
MRRALLAVAFAPFLAAQAPITTFTEDFFNGDRRKILKTMGDATRELKPRDAKYLAECGRAYLAAGDKTRASETFRLAEALEPKDGKVLCAIAAAWLKHGYRTEALEAFELVLTRDPGNKDAIMGAAVDLAETGMVPQAEKFMNHFLAMEGSQWEAFVAFGKAMLVSGQRKKASPWFARAIAVKPKEEKVYAEIARAFAETQSGL